MSMGGPSKSSYDAVFYLPSVTALLGDCRGRPGGGAETQVVALGRALARRGVKVCLIAFPSEGLPSSFEGVDIAVRPASKARQRVVGRLRESARIYRTIARVPARVVIVRVAGSQVGLVAISAKLLRRKFVYSSANLFDFDYEALGLKRRDLALYRLGLRLADEIVVQTDDQVRLCQARLGRTATLVRSIVEPGGKGLGEPEAFLWIGRLVSYKRPMAFVELARSLPDVKCRMVGVPTQESGSLVEDIHRAAADMPNLELLKPRPRAEILNLIDHAAAVVNTSEFEGMPNASLEGWARGVPTLTLAYDPDGVIEQYGLGEFARGSFDDFVVAGRRLWESRYESVAVAERCRRYVAEHHAEDVVAEEWERALGIAALYPGARVLEGFA